MSNLIVVGAIIAAHKYNSRTYTKSESKSDKENNTFQDYTGEKTTYSFKEFLNGIVSENDNLDKFFRIMTEHVDNIDKKDKLKASKVVQALAKKYIEEKEVCERLLENLKENGLIITEDIRGPEHYEGVISKFGELGGFGGVGKFGYNRGATFCEGFNGIRITKDMLENEGNNPYEANWEEWQEENGDVSRKIEGLNEQLETKKKKLKTTLFNRETKKEEISDLEKELKECFEIYEDGSEKKSNYEAFRNLTSEQKKAIYEYLKQTNKCQRIGEKMEEEIDYCCCIGRSNFYVSTKEVKDRIGQRNEYTRAIDEALLEGNITKDEIEEVNKTLLEIDPNKEVYEKGINYTVIKSSRTTSQTVEWYFDNVIRNLQLEKKEEELSILEKEEKEILKEEKENESKREVGEE